MPKSITIRDVPDSTARRLATRAASTGRSLQEYLRGHLIEWAERPDPQELVARIRERKASTGSSLSAADILELRDEGRQ
ncbi:MAG: hypothetical protein HKN72_09685 [Gemmatimonadetes bacterium]|nr:hypothetical protein [Gemmatimonadota bacterium]